MPGRARTELLDLQGLVAQWALVLLAFVLLLNVADPTPRFVGLPLASEQGPHAPASPSVYHSGESYLLPDGVSTGASATSGLARLCLSSPEAFAAPDGGPTHLARLASRPVRVRSLDVRDGPPLRC